MEGAANETVKTLVDAGLNAEAVEGVVGAVGVVGMTGKNQDLKLVGSPFRGADTKTRENSFISSHELSCMERIQGDIYRKVRGFRLRGQRFQHNFLHRGNGRLIRSSLDVENSRSLKSRIWRLGTIWKSNSIQSQIQASTDLYRAEMLSQFRDHEQTFRIDSTT